MNPICTISNIKKRISLFGLLVLIAYTTYAQQGVAINQTGNVPAPSAMLDISSDSLGLLIPRMTFAQKEDINVPATGLIIYQTDSIKGLWTYDGTVWVAISSQLQKITEGGNTGHRILGRDTLNYGNIGFNALDLSFSDVPSTTIGATSSYSTALGYNTTASDQAAIAMGEGTNASGNTSTAMGHYSTASGTFSTAMGSSTIASGDGSTATGFETTASGIVSTAMGQNTFASGEKSTAMGLGTTASGNQATAIGHFTIASGHSSTAMGDSTLAKSYCEVAIGSYNTNYIPNNAYNYNAADRAFGVGIGSSSSAPKDGLIVFKDGTLYLDTLNAAPTTPTNRLYVLNDKLHYNGQELNEVGQTGLQGIQGVDGPVGPAGPGVPTGGLVNQVLAKVNGSDFNTQWVAASAPSELQKITEGSNTGHRILGRNPANYGNIGSNAIDLSFSLSASTTRGATGQYSTAMGNETTASGNYSSAMGYFTTASGYSSAAMGYFTTASGYSSAAMGYLTTGSGYSSTAMGFGTIASGASSTAMGFGTTASGASSTAMGNETSAKSYGELAAGSFNTDYTPISSISFNAADRAFGIGIGSSSTARKDGLIVYKDGTLYLDTLNTAPTIAAKRLYVLNDKLHYNGQELNEVGQTGQQGIQGVVGPVGPAGPGVPTGGLVNQVLAKVDGTDLNTQWVAASAPSELQKITEGSNTGHRILGRDPANYGNIGSNAIDLSFSPSASTTRGATGPYSTALGFETTSSGGYSLTMGSDTKASGNNSVAMGEFSFATGSHSLSMGYDIVASGSYSVAMGNDNLASGTYSTAMGKGSTASGTSSSALGNATTATSFAEVAIGSYNSNYTPSSATSFNATDRAFGVGIGSSSTVKKDGLIVYKNGTLYLDTLNAAPSTTTNRLYVLNDKLHYNGETLAEPSWELGGNTGNTTSHFLGTTDNKDIVLKSFSNETARFYANPISGPDDTTTVNRLILTRRGETGTNWDMVAAFQMGSYKSGIAGNTQLDIALNEGNNANPNVKVMSLLGNGQVGMGTSTPNASAKVEISSTTSGFLPPRMTTNQQTSISSPAEGLMVYNTVLKKPFFFDGSNWQSFDGASLQVGYPYQGGIVAYILQSGDIGYIAGETHGLIAATSDQSAASWGCSGTGIPGADGTAIGTGNQNTIDIVAGCTTAGIAAKICLDLSLGGYTDWYLPSSFELLQLYNNRTLIGSFGTGIYWSSSEIGGNNSTGRNFSNGTSTTTGKATSLSFRAIRSF